MCEFFKKDNNESGDFNNENVKDCIDVTNEKEKENGFALYLLFSKVPDFNRKEIKKRIKKICNSNVEIQNILEKEDTNNIFGFIDIDGEVFKLVGLDVPLPKEIINYTVNCAYGQREELEAMNNNTYHIIAFYEGENNDYNAIYNAYAKLAYGFQEDSFVGMANEYAWNALTPSIIKELFEDEKLSDFLSTPAMMIWRNFVKMPYEGKVWFVTKGNNIFGIHEYAFKGDSFEDSQQVYDMFEDIFNYEYTSKSLIVFGNTIQIGDDISIRFRELYEIEDELQGEGIGTLVLELITRDEIDENQ